MPQHTISERLKRLNFRVIRQPRGRFSLEDPGKFGQRGGLFGLDISEQEISGIDQGLFADVQPTTSVTSKRQIAGIGGIESVLGPIEQNIRNALKAQSGDSINVAGTTISRSEAQRLLGQEITAQPEQVATEQTEQARASEQATQPTTYTTGTIYTVVSCWGYKSFALSPGPKRNGRVSKKTGCR